MRTALCFCILTAAIAASAAAGDGGPSPGVSWGWDGVAGRAGQLRYVALPSGSGTIVAAVRVHGGRIVRWATIKGSYGVPLVAADGSAGGLSHDLKTLVLASFTRVPNPRAVTRLAVLNTKNLRLRQVVTLRGAFSFDALSPDGTTLYLIQYTSAENYNRYRVRAYDLGVRRLLAGSIVDKREPKEAMTGSPVHRVESTDGSWAYTLYSRQGAPPFVHALDTLHREAVCLDLPWKGSQNPLWRMRMSLSPGGSTLVLRGASRKIEIDVPS